MEADSHPAAWMCIKIWIGSHHDRFSSRQRAADGCIGPSTHYDWKTHGDGFEVGQVFRDLPGNGIVMANDPAAGQGGNDDQLHTR